MTEQVTTEKKITRLVIPYQKDSNYNSARIHHMTFSDFLIQKATQRNLSIIQDEKAHIVGSKLIALGHEIPKEDSLILCSQSWETLRLCKVLRALGYRIENPAFVEDGFFEYKERLYPVLERMGIRTVEWSYHKPFLHYPQLKADSSGNFDVIDTPPYDNCAVFIRIPDDQSLLKVSFYMYMGVPTLGFIIYQDKHKNKYIYGISALKDGCYSTSFSEDGTINLDDSETALVKDYMNKFEVDKVNESMLILSAKLYKELKINTLNFTGYYDKDTDIISVLGMYTCLSPEFYDKSITTPTVYQQVWDAVKDKFGGN